MKKFIAALALTAAACATPAFADIGFSIRIGEPGFYGRLDIDSGYSPRLVFNTPLLIERGHRNLQPVYLRVPAAHYRYWNRYCGQYGACAYPVYFVQDDWYRDVYIPRYRQRHDHDRHDDRWDGRRDRNDDRWDNRHDRRDDRRDGRDDRRDDRRDNDRGGRGHDNDRGDHGQRNRH